ncbi:MAG: nuclear transport factor 2 family protein [Pseudomonadota bacterium]
MQDNARLRTDCELEAQVLAAIEEETNAFRAGDFDRWCNAWLHSPRTVEAYASHEFGLNVIRGWDAVRANMAQVFKNDLRCKPGERGFDISNLEICVDATTAWAVYDQRWWNPDGETYEDNFETRILELHDNAWKIVMSSVISARATFSPPGRIGVDADRHVIWQGPGAADALKTHPGLTISHGKLRGRRLDWDRALGEVLEQAARYHGFFEARDFAARTGRPFRCPLILGEDEAGSVLTCVVSVRDGVTYIDTDPASEVEARLAMAEAVFGLSAAQTRLAREIVAGRGLTAAATALGVSINTARTQLGRIYDKTGVNSQTALVRLLLSVG